MRAVVRLLPLVALALFAGCAPAIHIPKHYYNPDNPIKRVAILPMKNETLDVEGPDVVRGKMEEVFREKGYNVRSMKEADQVLRDQMGISLGGQLDLTTPQKLGEVLGVDGVLYGTLLDFDDITIGLYNVRKVRARFKFVNTAAGETIWEGGLGVKSELISGDAGIAVAIAAEMKDAPEKETPWVTLERIIIDRPLEEAMALGLGAKLLTKALRIHLEREATEMVIRVAKDLPWGPGPGAVEKRQ